MDGKLSHFQRKVINEVEQQKSPAVNENCPPQDTTPTAAPPRILQEITNQPNLICTRKTSKQKNVQWQNEKAKRACTEQNYKTAFKIATTLFHQKKNGTSSDRRSQEQIIDSLNKQYNLDGDGIGKEKNKLAVSTVRRYVDKGNYGCSPKKKGKSPEVSREWKELVAVHINVTQASTVGEADGAAIKGAIRASVMGTEYEGKFNLKKAWEDIRRLHADTLVPSGHLAADDIRYQWCTLTNIKDQQSKFKASL